MSERTQQIMELPAETRPIVLWAAVAEVPRCRPRTNHASTALLAGLLDDELHFREDRQVRTILRLSCLPTGQTLATFDSVPQLSVQRSKIDSLAICTWLRAIETLLIRGAPGVGKSHLAIELVMEAIENGIRVLRDPETAGNLVP